MADFAAAIQSDVLRRLVAHWSQMRGERRMPARADFDPLAVRYALGYLSLIEVHRDPLRFYFRLDGTKQVELFGVDCATLSGRGDATRSRGLAASLSRTRSRSEPLPQAIRFHERLIEYEAVILPFSNDGERVDLLMTGIVPDRPL
jgi:hypothetical protein